MICGLEGRYMRHLANIRDVIGLAPGVHDFSAMSLVITGRGAYFLADTQVTPEPTAEEIAEMVVHAAEHVRRFGITPKIALLSHSNFGSYESPSACKMREACALLAQNHPDLEVDGEMHGDAALNPMFRERVFPYSRLKDEANVLIMPNLDAANIAYQMIKELAGALAGRADPGGCCAPGPYSYAGGHRARRGQHDGDCGGRSAGRAGVISRWTGR